MSKAQSTNDENTRMMLHLDGIVGTQVIVDDALGSLAPKTFVVGNAEFTTEQVNFGATSLRCYGLDNSIKVQGSPEWNFGRSVWTVDAWFYALAEPCAMCWYLDDENYMGFVLVRWTTTTATYRIRYVLQGRVIGESNLFTANVMGEWTHLAMSAAINVISSLPAVSSHYDGVLGKTFTNTSDVPTLDFGSFPLYVGRCPIEGRAGLGGLDGYLDEVRVHAGPLITTDIPAGTEYDLPTQATALRRKITGTGRHNVYEPGFKVRGEGVHLVGGKQIRITGAGQHNVREAFKVRGTGQHNVLESGFKVRGEGEHNVGSTSATQLRRFDITGTGRHNVYDSFQIRGNGTHTLLSLAIQIRGAGQHDVRRRYSIRGEGQHSVRHAIQLTERGIHDVKKTTTKYALYYLFGSEPDLDAAPWQTFAALPYETPAITGTGKHYFVLRILNDFGLESKNILSTIIELDSSDNEVAQKPNAPDDYRIKELAAGAVNVAGEYSYLSDPNPADSFLVYVTITGSDPDPSVDSPVVVPMVESDGIARLDYNTSAFGGGVTVKVLVRTRITTGTVNSANLTPIRTFVTNITGPAKPTLQVVQARTVAKVQIA